MLLRNSKRYKINEEKYVSKTNNIETPIYSYLNKSANILKIRQNPDENLNRKCHKTFSNPTFNLNDNLHNHLNNLNDIHKKLDPIIINLVRQNFRNAMMDIQNENKSEREEEIDLQTELDNYRKRTYSLDIPYIEECIRNGTINNH
jgi:hypothetical protein